MTTKKHPRTLTGEEADAIVAAFDEHDLDEYDVSDAATQRELRAAAAARREAPCVDVERRPAATSPRVRHRPLVSAVFLAMSYLVLSSCTVDGHDPLSAGRDCQAAIDRAAPALRDIMKSAVVPEVVEPRVVESISECASSDRWMDSVSSRLRPVGDEMDAFELWELVCGLEPDAPAGCGGTAPTSSGGGS